MIICFSGRTLIAGWIAEMGFMFSMDFALGILIIIMKFMFHPIFPPNSAKALKPDLPICSCKGSRTIRKSAKVVTMSLEGPPPPRQLVTAWGCGDDPPPLVTAWGCGPDPP